MIGITRMVTLLFQNVKLYSALDSIPHTPTPLYRKNNSRNISAAIEIKRNVAGDSNSLLSFLTGKIYSTFKCAVLTFFALNFFRFIIPQQFERRILHDFRILNYLQKIANFVTTYFLPQTAILLPFFYAVYKYSYLPL